MAPLLHRLAPPRFDDPELDEQAALVHFVLWLQGSAIALLGFIYAFFPSMWTGLISVVPLLGLFLVARHLLHRGHVTAAAAVNVGYLCLFATAMCFLAGGFSAGLPPVLAVIALMGAVMLGRTVGLALTAWAVAVQVAVFGFGASSVLLTEGTDPATVTFATTVMNTVVVGFVVSWGVHRVRQGSAAARRQAASLAEANEQSEAAAREAEEANRAKSQFLTSMSHELRTPLNAILGYSEILMEDLDDDALSEDAQRIHRAGSHLLSLINDVLDMAKVESGRMELHLDVTSVPALLHEVVHTARPIADAQSNQLRVEIDEDLGELWLDERKTRQILLNLLSNAAKFTEQGTVTIRARRDAAGLTVDVVDTGCGIPSSVLPTLFRPFVQAPGSSPGGTGLGLALSQRFAEMMHGHIAVTSTLDVGSQFTLWVPDLTHWATQVDPGHGPLVQCVDDDLATLGLLSRLLQRDGMRTGRSTNAQHALHQAAEEPPDILVLDVTLPDSDGWSLAHRLRDLPGCAEVPLVFISVEDPPTRLPPGTVAYLVKPIQPAVFRRAIQDGLDGTRGTPEVATHLPAVRIAAR